LPFTEIQKGKAFYPFGRTVGFKKSLDGNSVEPPERVKRLVGKTYLLMDRKGCIKLSDSEIIVFSVWALD